VQADHVAMKWGEVYRTRERLPERGHQPGFYVAVSRDFVAGHEDLSTAICAPVYGDALGLRTEVVIGTEDGVPRQSAVRCDFLTLMVKKQLTGFVTTLSAGRQRELKQALAHALQLDQ
jgi:mRNA-degrading endonuclease toxin of MazEF toxin-antitoxin module